MATRVKDEESIGTIGRELVDDVRRLVQLEVELAKAQMVQTMKRALLGASLVIAALALLLIALSYAVGAVAEPLGALNHWWGWLATSGTVIAVAVLLAYVGYLRIRKGIKAAQTAVTSIKGDAEWLKQLTKRNSSAS